MIRKLLVISLLFCIGNSSFAQNKVISGLVVGKDDNLPIPGVSVKVEGLSTVGTQTSIDGTFKLSVPQNATLLFSSELVTQIWFPFTSVTGKLLAS